MTKLADGRLPDFDYEKGTMVSLRDDEETHVLVEFEVSEYLSTIFVCMLFALCYKKDCLKNAGKQFADIYFYYAVLSVTCKAQM